MRLVRQDDEWRNGGNVSLATDCEGTLPLSRRVLLAWNLPSLH